MRSLGNILWHFPCLGFLTAIFVCTLGVILTVTVVGAPIGLGLIQYAKFLLLPFSSAMVDQEDLNISTNRFWKSFSLVARVIYFPFGLVLFVMAALQVVVMMITIVGIPAALVLAKSLGVFLNPVNKVCVPHIIGEELRKQNEAKIKEKYLGIPTTNPSPANLGNEASRQTNVKQATIAPIQQSAEKDNPHLRYRDVFPEKCPGCGTPRAEGFSFCGTCGNTLEVLKRQAICAACGNDVDDSAENCPSCGQLLVEQPSPTDQWACMACGMQNMAEDSFCGKCGTRRDSDARQTTQTSMPNSVGNRLEPSNSQSTSFLLIAVVGVLCAIGVFYFVTQQRESQSLSVAKTPATTNTPTTQPVTPQTAQEEEELFEEESEPVVFDDQEPMVAILKGKNINIRYNPSINGEVAGKTSDPGVRNVIAYLVAPRPIYDSDSNMNWYEITYYITNEDGMGARCYSTREFLSRSSLYISGKFVEVVPLKKEWKSLLDECVNIGSNVDTIVNTLRSYKSAALMYYTDNSEWPSGTNLQNILDAYTDPHLDTRSFTTVQTVDMGNGRVLIGLVGATGSPLTQANIQAKLESQAESFALCAADGTSYVAGTAAVYMNMR